MTLDGGGGVSDAGQRLNRKLALKLDRPANDESDTTAASPAEN